MTPIFFYQFSRSFHNDASIKIEVPKKSKTREKSKDVRNAVYRAKINQGFILIEYRK